MSSPYLFESHILEPGSNSTKSDLRNTLVSNALSWRRWWCWWWHWWWWSFHIMRWYLLLLVRFPLPLSSFWWFQSHFCTTQILPTKFIIKVFNMPIPLYGVKDLHICSPTPPIPEWEKNVDSFKPFETVWSFWKTLQEFNLAPHHTDEEDQNCLQKFSWLPKYLQIYWKFYSQFFRHLGIWWVRSEMMFFFASAVSTSLHFVGLYNLLELHLSTGCLLWCSTIWKNFAR